MEVRTADCPLGAKCEEVKTGEDGHQILYRCPWYVKMKGKNPQPPGEDIDHWRCAIAWMPILTTENTKEVIEMSASIDSFRNEMVRGQQAVLQNMSSHTPPGLVPGYGVPNREELKEIEDARDDHS